MMAEWIQDSQHGSYEASPTDVSTCQSEGGYLQVFRSYVCFFFARLSDLRLLLPAHHICHRPRRQRNISFTFHIQLYTFK